MQICSWEIRFVSHNILSGNKKTHTQTRGELAVDYVQFMTQDIQYVSRHIECLSLVGAGAQKKQYVDTTSYFTLQQGM